MNETNLHSENSLAPVQETQAAEEQRAFAAGASAAFDARSKPLSWYSATTVRAEAEDSHEKPVQGR